MRRTTIGKSLGLIGDADEHEGKECIARTRNMKLSTAFLPFAILILISTHSVCATIPATAVNCNLREPPKLSGEVEFLHGSELRVYPRAKTITPRYTGCQLAWIKDATRWQRVITVYIVDGDIRRVEIINTEDRSQSSTCGFEKGKLTDGPIDFCGSVSAPTPEFLPMKSLAAGCLASKEIGVRTTLQCTTEE